jgi:hypothetical protein
MEVEQEMVIPDLRAKITGKPAPPRVELTTKPKQPKPPFAIRNVRFKNQAKMLVNTKALTTKALERKKNAPQQAPLDWTRHFILCQAQVCAEQAPPNNWSKGSFG